MKKYIVLLLCVAMGCMLISCGDTSSEETKEITKATESTEERTQASTAEEQTTTAETESQDLSNGNVDVDLSKLNQTMAISEITNMLNNPDKYVGKVVRMKGAFSPYVTDARNYYNCMISDTTACCQYGLEFLWAGEHQYPNDYPAENTEIVVEGIFDTYYEGSDLYVQLKDASLSF